MIIIPSYHDCYLQPVNRDLNSVVVQLKCSRLSGKAGRPMIRPGYQRAAASRGWKGVCSCSTSEKSRALGQALNAKQSREGREPRQCVKSVLLVSWYQWRPTGGPRPPEPGPVQAPAGILGALAARASEGIMTK